MTDTPRCPQCHSISLVEEDEPMPGYSLCGRCNSVWPTFMGVEHDQRQRADLT